MNESQTTKSFVKTASYKVEDISVEEFLLALADCNKDNPTERAYLSAIEEKIERLNG